VVVRAARAVWRARNKQVERRVKTTAARHVCQAGEKAKRNRPAIQAALPSRSRVVQAARKAERWPRCMCAVRCGRRREARSVVVVCQCVSAS